MPAAAPDLERLRARLFDDTPFWAEHCAKIVDGRAQLVPLVANPAQVRFDAALEAQRAAGKPRRAIVLKARKMGFSTWVQAKLMHQITQRRFQRALVVAQDTDTAGELFSIGQRIWENLPPDPALGLKPPRTSFRRGRELAFGEPSRMMRDQGIVGLDSKLEIDTANEVEAGRGYTYTQLHLSEVAFWPHVAKITALVNAVPDTPDTLIVLESTANGHNHFKSRWDSAVAGESEYAPIFAAWHEDARYQLPFPDEEARERFRQMVGVGPWGEDEPRLIEQFGCTLEQLNWRRRTIVDKCESKLEVFHQEYPASPEEAFLSSGKHVFSMSLVSRVMDQCRQTDPETFSPDNPGPEVGMLEPSDWAKRKSPRGMIEVPLSPVWRPRQPPPFRRLTEEAWRVWEHPDPGSTEGGAERLRGQYVVMLDPAEGEETASGENAFHGLTVINHRTRELAAELQSRMDPDLIGVQLYLAAVYWNNALLSVEKTGGYGLSILRQVHRDYKYPRIYRQKILDRAKDSPFEDRLGWDTNRATKALIEDGIKELVRKMPHVFKSFVIASQMTTYVKDPRGKTGPEADAFSDLLMSFGIGQQIAQEWPVPTEAKTSSTTTRAVRSSIAGY